MNAQEKRYFIPVFILSTLLAMPTMVSGSIIRSTAVVEGHNNFAIDLYRTLGHDSGNLFFSPLSISTALSMTYDGANGETASQMQKTLHFLPSRNSLNEGNRALLKLLESSQLKQANSLWPDYGETLLESFIYSLKKNYGAECQSLDFARNPEDATEVINKWVEEKTLGRITDLLHPDDIDSGTRLVLANAIVFDGKWEQAFDPAKTVSMPFKLAGGGVTQVKGMVQKGHFSLATMDGFSVLEIPFMGKKTSLLIALPDQVDGLPELEKRLTPKAVTQWISQMTDTELTLAIPRLEMDERTDLSRVLIKMGMVDAFDHNADFSGMTGDLGLFIDKVIHQATLKIHEEGVEAAAATALTFKRFSIIESFRVDRPFVFMIRHQATGSILFMGRMVNPEN